MRLLASLILTVGVALAAIQNAVSQPAISDSKIGTFHPNNLIRRSPMNKELPANAESRRKATAARRERNLNAVESTKERPRTPDGMRERYPTKIRAQLRGPAELTITKDVYGWNRQRIKNYVLKDEEKLEKESSNPHRLKAEIKIDPGGAAHFAGQGRKVWTKNRDGAAIAETWSPTEGKKRDKNGIAKAASATVDRPVAFTYDQESEGKGTVSASNARSYSPERSPGRDPSRLPWKNWAGTKDHDVRRL